MTQTMTQTSTRPSRASRAVRISGVERESTEQATAAIITSTVREPRASLSAALAAE
jgi:hypothetical protein